MAKSGGMSASKIALELQRLSNEATEKSFVYNREEANTARAWQTEMSNTSHQREVADLKAAGLNPVLSANNGAQSYTTSSASAQAENAANAVGNVWSSDISARATRAAAAQSAAATRYAAAAQASAQRYAASLAYQAKIEGYKNNIDVANVKGDWSYRQAIDTPVKSIGGAIDKFANKAGLYDLVGSNAIKGLVNKSKLLLDNPSKFFKEVGQGAKITSNNFKTTVKGNKFINDLLYKMGIVDYNQYRRNLFVKAFVFGNNKAANELYSIVDSYKKNKNSASRIHY